MIHTDFNNNNYLPNMRPSSSLGDKLKHQNIGEHVFLTKACLMVAYLSYSYHYVII